MSGFLDCRFLWDTYISLAHHDLDYPALRYYLRQIAQSNRLLAVLIRSHAQILEQLRVEAPARTKFGKVILQSLNGRCNVCFEGGEIKRIFDRRIFGSSLLLFSSPFAAFFE